MRWNRTGYSQIRCSHIRSSRASWQRPLRRPIRHRSAHRSSHHGRLQRCPRLHRTSRRRLRAGPDYTDPCKPTGAIANPRATAQDEINVCITSSFSAARLPPCQTDVTRDEQVPVLEGCSERFYGKFLPWLAERVGGTHFRGAMEQWLASEITHVYPLPRDLQYGSPVS